MHLQSAIEIIPMEKKGDKMKRYLLGVCIFVFCGCSALSGYLQAQHNGLYYWFLQGCEHYRYSYGNPNTLYCVDENQNPTGVVLQPASQDRDTNLSLQKRA